MSKSSSDEVKLWPRSQRFSLRLLEAFWMASKRGHLTAVDSGHADTADLDLSIFHDDYREKIEAMISSKLKGEAVQVQERKPKKPAAKSIMEALRETAESLK
jgi:hypothetical protein